MDKDTFYELFFYFSGVCVCVCVGGGGGGEAGLLFVQNLFFTVF